MSRRFADDASQPHDRQVLAGLAGANAVAWLGAAWCFGDRPALLGTALLAWVFGLRHALDADHIAAIDNVVRRLLADGRRAGTVGLWFSLGHSTIVVLACAAVALGAGALIGEDTPLARFGAVAGTMVSAGFLLVIALANLVLLRGTWRAFRAARAGHPMATDLGTGVLARLLGPVLRAVRRPAQMYPVGFLFGLGFDTATEVGLLAIAATQIAAGLSPWAVLVFPALFTAGMSLVDTADSMLMTRAYGWAGVDPARKLWYNLTITGAAVAVALFIGAVEVLGALGDALRLDNRFWRAIASLNDNLTALGVSVVLLFVACWVASVVMVRRTEAAGG
jgi:high-affinity nickel-transport protein